MTKVTINDSVVGWDEIETCAVRKHTEYFGKVQSAAAGLSISKEFAAAIVYLRTQSYYSQELEDVLVDMYKSDEVVPNMLVWGK